MKKKPEQKKSSSEELSSMLVSISKNLRSPISNDPKPSDNTEEAADIDEAEAHMHDWCPICNHHNILYEETSLCEHYIGAWLDCDLLWEKYNVNEFWGEAESAIYELDGNQYSELKSLFSDPFEIGILNALEQIDHDWWLGYVYMISHKSVGIFGDAADTLYHENPTEFCSRISNIYKRIEREAKKIVETARTNASENTEKEESASERGDNSMPQYENYLTGVKEQILKDYPNLTEEELDEMLKIF